MEADRSRVPGRVERVESLGEVKSLLEESRAPGSRYGFRA